MRIHCVQHVAFEDSAAIGRWAEGLGHTVSRTLLYKGQALPATDRFDMLAVMGGPMNVYEERTYPWLAKEKDFIKRAIAEHKTVLGICLGAQLIAAVLGGEVKRNQHKEIGWYQVTLTAEAACAPLLKHFPRRFMAFHWHGDTFTIPPGAMRVGASSGCDNQAFLWGERVVGLQFHLESTEQSIRRLIRHCGNELTAGRYIQRKPVQLVRRERIVRANHLMYALLDNVARLSSQNSG